jgi:hypothetical protein
MQPMLKQLAQCAAAAADAVGLPAVHHPAPRPLLLLLHPLIHLPAVLLLLLLLVRHGVTPPSRAVHCLLLSPRCRH